MVKSLPIDIHVVSDATGTGVDRLARAALVQFRAVLSPTFIRHSFIKNRRQLARILDQAQENGGVVVYTLNDKHLRDWLDEQQYVRGIEIIDLLGPLLRRIGRRYKARPQFSSRLLPSALGEKALKLSGCIDYTMAHDDGRRTETLGMADIILLGVSRTNKTPTSVYLSSHFCLKVANIPLVPGVEPPEKLFRLKRPRVVGLTIAAAKLAQVRRNRFKKGMVESYYDLANIAEELDRADSVFARLGDILIIDVTDRTIEEVAGLIVESL